MLEIAPIPVTTRDLKGAVFRDKKLED